MKRLTCSLPIMLAISVNLLISGTGCSPKDADTTPAAQPSTAQDPVDELSAALTDLRGGERPIQNNAPTPDTDIARELAALREQVFILEQRFDEYLGAEIADLASENALLREELARLYAQDPDRNDPSGPQVPRPRSELIAELMREAAARRPQPSESDKPPIDFGEEEYLVLKQWGRTPEDATRLGTQVTSLIGMICVVPPGLEEAELIALGQHMRAQFEGYTNINIAAFDDMDAANTYVTTNKKMSNHHVMDVSRHPQSDLDHIILFKAGHVIQKIAWAQ